MRDGFPYIFNCSRQYASTYKISHDTSPNGDESFSVVVLFFMRKDLSLHGNKNTDYKFCNLTNTK